MMQSLRQCNRKSMQTPVCVMGGGGGGGGAWMREPSPGVYFLAISRFRCGEIR